MKLSQALLNLTRGVLIGTAEVIPGVSGGTIALVVGLYDRVINSASEFLRGLALLLRGSKSGWGAAHFRKVEWAMLMPLLVGMGIALVAGAAIIEPLLSENGEIMRALFAGMIIASLLVPIRMVTKWGAFELALSAIGAVAAFSLTSIERSTSIDPSLVFVFFSAAFAICALVLPGVSGSFLLLALGVYQPTIAAVNDRDLVYLGTFALGAVFGLASFAFLLQWLLANHHGKTMALMTGLMIGSLRALWPWQTDQGQLLAPDSIAAPMSAVLAGLAVVATLIYIEDRFSARAQ